MTAPLCAAPWSHLYIDVDGCIYLCCLSEHPGMPGGTSTPLGNIREHTLQQVWSSSYLAGIRSDFLSGQFTEGQCWNCREGLRRGLPASTLLLGRFNRESRRVVPGESPPTAPVSLNIHLGNLCNLQCIQCNPKYSSRHNGNVVTDPHTDNQLFAESFRALLPTLAYVNFGGGEPLLNDNLYRYLDMIIEARSGAVVSFVSNLTTLPSRLLERLPGLYYNTFQVSLDGVGESYEKIRKGARWDVVRRNLRELSRFRKKYNVREICINTCVMTPNYRDLDALLDLCVDEDIHLRVIPVYFPRDLSPFFAAPDTRARMREYFESLRGRRGAELGRYCANEAILSHLT